MCLEVVHQDKSIFIPSCLVSRRFSVIFSRHSLVSTGCTAPLYWCGDFSLHQTTSRNHLVVWTATCFLLKSSYFSNLYSIRTNSVLVSDLLTLIIKLAPISFYFFCFLGSTFLTLHHQTVFNSQCIVLASTAKYESEIGFSCYCRMVSQSPMFGSYSFTIAYFCFWNEKKKHPLIFTSIICEEKIIEKWIFLSVWHIWNIKYR